MSDMSLGKFYKTILNKLVNIYIYIYIYIYKVKLNKVIKYPVKNKKERLYNIFIN